MLGRNVLVPRGRRDGRPPCALHLLVLMPSGLWDLSDLHRRPTERGWAEVSWGPRRPEAQPFHISGPSASGQIQATDVFQGPHGVFQEKEAERLQIGK